MSKKKKIIIIISIVITVLILGALIFLFVNKNKPSKKEETLSKLPLPELSGGARGELGIDKNINESTIDKYLGRSDSVYRDMRMLEDPGNYEAIGGDRYLSGYIKGFEVIPLPYIIPVTGLPSEVGETYTGTTLFYNDNGTYVANYKESMKMIEKIFPKDKVIFLMCGGGGYAGMTKNFLVSLGWDEKKIYNVGGYWYYKGKNSIQVKKEVDGKVTYDFDKVPYHKIEFDKLTKSDKYKENSKVKEVKLSTNKIEIEQGASFKLEAIVLPNEAPNKDLTWESEDEKIATVEDGLVKAIKDGTVTITATSVDGKKSASCEVVVKKKVTYDLKIDDVSKEASELAMYDIDKLQREFNSKIYDESGYIRPEYSIPTEDGGYYVNDLWREEYNKYEANIKQYINKRIEILNRLVDSKKTFIITIHNSECDAREYSVFDGAAKLLTQKNISYVSFGTETSNGDETLTKSKLDISKLGSGSLVIVKNGKIFAGIDSNYDSIKNDEELINWLGKYISDFR